MCAVSMPSCPKIRSTPAPNVDHKQHVVPDQPHHRQHLDRQEVHPGDRSQVGLYERCPRILSLSLRRRLNAVLGEDPLDGGPPDVVAHVVQGVAQPRVAPGRVPRGHLQQQSHDLSGLLQPRFLLPSYLAATKISFR